MSGDATASVRERLARGSIAQRSRRPQRGMIGTEAVREAVPGDTTASVRERLARGKHRTEVTEATEGNDWDGGCE